MKIYLAPTAIGEARELPYKTPKAFREHYEKPEYKDDLAFILVDVSTRKPSIMPEGIDLENGFNYVLFYSSLNELHPNTRHCASEHVPPNNYDWIYTLVQFGEKNGDYGYFESIGDCCIGLYYVGDNAPTRDDFFYKTTQTIR